MLQKEAEHRKITENMHHESYAVTFLFLQRGFNNNLNSYCLIGLYNWFNLHSLGAGERVFTICM